MSQFNKAFVAFLVLAGLGAAGCTLEEDKAKSEASRNAREAERKREAGARALSPAGLMGSNGMLGSFDRNRGVKIRPGFESQYAAELRMHAETITLKVRDADRASRLTEFGLFAVDGELEDGTMVRDDFLDKVRCHLTATDRSRFEEGEMFEVGQIVVNPWDQTELELEVQDIQNVGFVSCAFGDRRGAASILLGDIKDSLQGIFEISVKVLE